MSRLSDSLRLPRAFRRASPGSRRCPRAGGSPVRGVRPPAFVVVVRPFVRVPRLCAALRRRRRPLLEEGVEQEEGDGIE